MESVESSIIESVGYKDGILHIKFRNGDLYEYRGVPSDIHKDFMQAASKKGYYRRHIGGRFGEHKIDSPGG